MSIDWKQIQKEGKAMEYPSLSIASYIANICKENNMTYDDSKIQRLMYCCYGCVLAAYGERLCDEYPRAWAYGPVFLKVHKHISEKKEILYISPHLENTSEDVLELLTDVVKKFGMFTTSSLSKWVCAAGSPWDIVVNELDAPNSIIPDDLISNHFKRNVLSLEKEDEKEVKQDFRLRGSNAILTGSVKEIGETTATVRVGDKDLTIRQEKFDISPSKTSVSQPRPELAQSQEAAKGRFD
jgi:uncharacterized phage-associated protein